MKKILSFVLSLAILTFIAAIPTGAATYQPTDKYTVSADTPTCEEAIEACGGDLSAAQKVYFQLPAEDPDHPEDNWTNHYNSSDLGLDHCQPCVYWWQGTGSQWSDGTKAQWVGYKAKLIDAQNRIYEAAVPAGGEPSVIIWNNGVYGGSDPNAEIFGYAHQLKDADVTGAEPGDYDTLPEGSPDPDSMDGCIQIPDSGEPTTAVLYPGICGFDWYVYYGDGCYGNYPTDSPNYHGKHASCVNPAHDHSSDTYLRGDADADGSVTILDATTIQRKLADLPVASFSETAADVDANGLDIMDATRIQRYLADLDDPYHINEIVVVHLPSEDEALPAKVDLRNYNGKNYVTQVKCQMYGDCWSFSLAGAAEIAYLFANDMGVPAGEINKQVNFSEKYIVWYMFHGMTENDVAAGRVRASQVGEGFDPSEAEQKRELTPYFIGGPFVHDANLFGSGFGPVDESVEVDGEYPYAYDDSWTGGWTLPLNAEYRNAPSNAVLRNSYILPSPKTVDENGEYAFNEAGLNAIKSELCKGHGVSLAFCSTGGYNQENQTVYHGTLKTADHAVVAVGYDDSYPKENFTGKNYRGEEVKGSTPPADGALILKNSWGISNSEEDGYFYLSYYDQSIVSPLSYEFDAASTVKHTVSDYDQYDLMMTNWYGVTDRDSVTKTANVFDAEEDESLYQIEYRTGSPDTEVSYEIYKNVKDGDPSSGVLLEKGVSRHTYAGFYKIDLKSEHALKKGEKYAVVLTMKRAADDGKTVYSEVYPYSTEFYKGMTVKGVVNEGESYLFADGKWTDLSQLKDSRIDAAYAQCKAALGDTEEGKMLNWDKSAFTLDNYPIKAILAPAA